jgi:hypothetical protein
MSDQGSFEVLQQKSKRHELEDNLFAEFKLYGLPTPERQYIFHPTRKWRLDFAWPDRRIAVEVNGGIYMNKNNPTNPGGHNRGAYMELSYEKINEAQRLGWKVFMFGPSQCRGRKRTNESSAALAFMHNVLLSK